MFELANTQSIGDTPAMADRLEQKILINNDVWDKLNPEQRAAVLLHEFGHLIKDTPEEKLADSFAYQKQQGSAARFFAAFSSLLDPDQNPDHLDRLNNLGLIAANDIHQQTGRDLPKRIIRKSSRKHQMNYKSVFHQDPDPFLGIGNRKKKIQQALEATRTIAKAKIAESNLNTGSWALAQKANADQQSSNQQNQSIMKKSLPWIIGIAVIALVAYMIIKKRK